MASVLKEVGIRFKGSGIRFKGRFGFGPRKAGEREEGRVDLVLIEMFEFEESNKIK